MKKLLALLAVVLCVVSCQTEPEGLDVNVGGEIDAIVNVTIPEAETRAANSGIGVFNNGVLDGNATMRYILQVYYKTMENGEAKYTASDERKVEYSDRQSVAFEVRLVPDRDYKFVVWADVVASEADVDKHYNTANLENITLNDTWVAMDESRDAFTATELIEKFNGAKAINITLKRPFAKLRVVTTDMEALSNINITPYKATATYTTSHRVAFNALTGKAASASLEDKAHTYTITTYANEWDNNGVSNGTMTIFSDYFFAADDDIVKFNLNVYEENGNLIKPNAFQTDINVKPNYLTTIKGNILTDGKGFQVTIVDGFANIDPINGNNTDPNYEYTTITSAVELLRAIGTSGNYVIMNDIKVTEADVLIASTLAATRSTTTTTTINLNGFAITISNNSDEPLVTLEEGEKVVFAGDGAVKKDPNTDGEFINNSNDNTEVVFTGAEYDEEVFTEDVIDYADEFIKAFNNETSYTLPADIIVKQSLTLPAGKSFELDLNGKTLSAINSISDKNNDGKLTSADNVVFIDVRGNLTVKNGTMTLKHTGDNYGWNACTELFYVGFNGTLNLDGVKAENLGGSDMTYVVDMVNATNITVNVANSTLKSNYIPFRVFNNGSGMNNVTINNSTLEGVSRAFWVHIYSNADNGGKGVKSATLNLDIYGNGNTFIASNPNRIIEFGFTDEINFNAEGEQIVYDAARLKSIANYTNSGYSFKGETIKLAADIDLNNENWTAIGTLEANFCGTFDGCDYTIKNLKILVSEGKESKAYLGLFGYAKDATIKNVVFENVDINVACLDIDHSQGHIGAVAGSLEGTSTIENVTVKGDIKVYATQNANGASRVAVIAGGNSYGNVTMKDVHVIANKGSYLIANNNTGALAGQLQGKSVFENCSSNIDVTVNKFFAGGIIGIAAGDQTFTNCHTTGDIAVVAGREGRAHDQYRVGGIAGGWADGAKNVCTLTNCSYTGKVSGKNSDGSVANPLDYMGYVGRGYTLNGCQGSKVVIDGVQFVQKYNEATKAGIYNIINLEISNKAELFWLAQVVNSSKCTFAGQTVKLAADIDLNNEEWTPIGSAYEDHGFMGNFDGNGKTIKNLNITNISLDSDGYAYAGLFGVTEGVDADNENYIKNLTIENVTINTKGHIVAAAIAYPYYTNIENVLVKGNVNIKGGDYTSGVLAYTRRCVNAKNVAIRANEGSVIEGNQTIGGVISDIQMNGGLTANYSNFEATGLTIKGVKSVGGISGIIALQTLNGATVKNVTIVCDDARKGIVSGSLGSTSTIENVVYENVTGADNVVGAGYDNCEAVVVNGNVYSVQK